MRVVVFVIGCLASGFAYSYSQDTGKISRIFVNPAGAIAFKLEHGFPKAVETNQCSTNNGWVGLGSSDPVVKSAILAAKAAGDTVTATIDGCEGTWFKLKDIYIN